MNPIDKVFKIRSRRKQVLLGDIMGILASNGIDVEVPESNDRGYWKHLYSKLSKSAKMEIVKLIK